MGSHLLHQCQVAAEMWSLIFCRPVPRDASISFGCFELQEKRRDTWCPGNLSKETLRELHYAVQEKASAMKPARDERDTGPLVPFEDLLNVANINASSEQKEDCKTNGLENCSLPDPHALLHVTSRKKPPLRKKISPKENHELVAMQAEYEDLLQKFETQKTISDIQIDYLTKQLGEAHFHMDEKCQDNSSCLINECTIPGKLNLLMTESEAIVVIKQLQEKIRILETEKSSSLQNLDSVVELATEQNIYAREKYEKLYEDVLKAQEEAKVAREQLTSMELVDNLKSFTNLLAGVQEVMLEVRSSTNLSQDLSSVVDELFQTVKAIWAQLAEFKIFASENSMQVKSIIRDHEKLQSCMRNKLNELKSEKVLLCNQSVDLHSKVQELSLNWQESENALKKFSEQNEMEISEFQYHIETLQKEISCLSSCSLAKEKENMRKDLEKTKTKLKETEFKLRNAIQEKTKLEGEKACAEREIKQLHGQKVILERDISKRDRCSIGFDPKRTKGIAVSFDQTMQAMLVMVEIMEVKDVGDHDLRVSPSLEQKCLSAGPNLAEQRLLACNWDKSKGSGMAAEMGDSRGLEDFGKLEVLAFEMERTIASLEDQLAATRGEKEEALSGIEHYALEMQVLSDKLNMSNTELSTLQDVVSSLRSSLEESQSYSEKLETSLNVLVQEKEELAMVAGRMVNFAKFYAYQNSVLRMEKSLEYHLQDDPRAAYDQGKRSQDVSLAMLHLVTILWSQKSIKALQLPIPCNQILEAKLEVISMEHHHACEEVARLRTELNVLNKERGEFSAERRELDSRSVLVDDFQHVKSQLLIMTKERDMLMARIEELQRHQLSMSKAEVDELTGRISNLEVKMHSDGVNNSKERAKLRMRLRGAQAKLDTFRVRYDEAVDELEFMNGQYEAASAKLKNQLASYGIEVLNLKKELASVKSH
ncbi:hypothetical protein RJ639_046568 [Escallonia herrerae]|uniref:Uncharacterized protein n=1 Tax=Escallonia herrerae TaxID=1293975 RepID=A0AA88WDG5_9ASTE|nr:hypothetical protein RJ639_046568 [Escallonia herrerae]